MRTFRRKFPLGSFVARDVGCTRVCLSCVNWQSMKNTQRKTKRKANEAVTREAAEKEVHEEGGSTGVEPTVLVEESPDEHKRLREKAAMWKEKYTRLYADFENFRKRSAKERIAFLKTANEGLITDLLPVIDDLERARSSGETKAAEKHAREGLHLIADKLVRILKKRGLQAMETKSGDAMDIEHQEVISQREPSDKGMEGKVLDVVEKGYLLEGKLIRFAKVVVGR